MITMRMRLETIRHEPERIMFWWLKCRLPLWEAIRATAENPTGFEQTYYSDLIEGHPKARLRLWRSRRDRRLGKIWR